MVNKLWLSSTLASLKLISKSPYLYKNTLNPKELSTIIGEFKQKLLISLDSNDLSDNFLVNAANCLYDLKAFDKTTSLALRRSFESRKNIITRELKGGVLWAFYNGYPNTKRRKLVNSSCRVAIKQAIKKFRDLKVKVTDVVEFEPIIRNLSVVGKCYRLPSSSKVRLEDSILEASTVFRLVFDCFPLLVPLTVSVASLNIHNEKIATILLDAFCDSLNKDDMITNDEIYLMLKTLMEWDVPKLGVERKCIELFIDSLSRKVYPFLNNTSATIKLFSQTLKLPKSDLLFGLSNILVKHVLLNVQFCTNTDLVTVIDAVSHFLFRYKSDIIHINMNDINKLVDNVICYLRVEYDNKFENYVDSPDTLNTLLKIYKSSVILSKTCGNNSIRLEEISLHIIKSISNEDTEDRILKIQDKFGVK
ncbi:hypothetical protein BEWA_017620 [Theileria equi strain WA]|uniref:Uncharacterized protein n=1 Tax=Theileria equi strain WA TaxID=1537102 RepID=L0AV89_THEEQ|nr:hypothetical protein BEWA_017620 [Theileria equi strain WA]AFZ78921.1 hypothetical protein BEWA_017620 [Theileria equi strain WA]|eukprot:XP_004828587.1 hypothetical protein BEWA_017620 [Theileria equi strain WA]